MQDRKYEGVTAMKLHGNLVAVAVSGVLMVLVLVLHALQGAVGETEPPVLSAPMPDISSATYSSTVYGTPEEAERICPGRWVSAVSPTDATERFRCMTGG